MKKRARSPQTSTAFKKSTLGERAEALLTKADLSRTQARIEVLKIFLADDCIQSVDDVFKDLRSFEFDLATIYRTVTAFEEAGLIERIQLADGLARFEFKHEHGHHHHHIICRSCKRIEIVNDCLGEKLDQIATKVGFSEVHHSLEFYGTCQKCVTKGPSGTARA